MRPFQVKKVILVVGDAILLYAALALTILIRYGTLTGDLWRLHIIPFTIVFGIWVIIFFINNLYSLHLFKHNFRFYGSLIQNLIICLLVGFSFFYLTPTSVTSLKPFRVLLLVILIFTVLFILWRRLFLLSLSNKSFHTNVLFLGLNDEAQQLIRALIERPHLGYRPCYVIYAPDQPALGDVNDIPHSRDIAQLRPIIEKYAVQTVVAVNSATQAPDAARFLFDIIPLGLTYYNFTDFYEKITGKVPVISLQKSWFIENLLSGQRVWYELLKRVQDVFFSILFGLLALPLVPFIIVGIKMTSPGPVLFVQTRTGRAGKLFAAMKFRTMQVNAESNGPQWATKNDPRVTSFGKFLRKTRLDELPQFINILKGDMSFVGPRPERPEFISMLTEQIPYYKERLLVKPGLTGWAQINFKYGETIADALTKLQYDLFYLKNRSFALDTSIVLKTIRTIFDRSLGQ